jgi:uroporphyrinogen-III synthase
LLNFWETTMALPLTGRTIALAEGRQLEELAGMLEAEGAEVVRCPLLSILDAPDPEPVVAWLRELSAHRFSYVTLLTGEGLRRLLGFADRAGIRADVIEGLRRSRIVTRGPKPVRALKEVSLVPSIVAPTPTTDGVIAALRNEPLRGQTVGVQLYSEANLPLTQFLELSGAIVRTVLPYVYAPAADSDRVTDLIDRMVEGHIDVLVFTSSPQVDRLYEVAKERGLESKLAEATTRTKVAAVGPIVAENLRGRGVTVGICPEQGFVMKNLVQYIKRSMSPGS